MNLALYYGVYGEGINKQAITKHNKPVKPRDLYYLTTDYVWRNWLKVENWEKAFIIKAN